jgi:hypothetical protein
VPLIDAKILNPPGEYGAAAGGTISVTPRDHVGFPLIPEHT